MLLGRCHLDQTLKMWLCPRSEELCCTDTVGAVVLVSNMHLYRHVQDTW